MPDLNRRLDLAYRLSQGLRQSLQTVCKMTGKCSRGHCSVVISPRQHEVAAPEKWRVGGVCAVGVSQLGQAVSRVYHLLRIHLPY